MIIREQLAEGVVEPAPPQPVGREFYMPCHTELRFQWLCDLNLTGVQTIKFTGVLFGLAPSPFLLGCVLESLESWSNQLSEKLVEILCSLNVDDLISGGPTVSKARDLKCDVIMKRVPAS